MQSTQKPRKLHTCSVEGCDRTSRSYMCGAHAQRLRKYGDTGPAEIRRMLPAGSTPAERIVMIGWTVDSDGCWIWNGRVDEYGYGRVDAIKGAPLRAHRVSYEKWNGPLDPGLVIMHSCDKPPCINPAHLSLGTVGENLRDMSDKGRAWNQQKTHCKHGHEFTPENTKIRTSANGRKGRKCVTCEKNNLARHALEKLSA